MELQSTVRNNGGCLYALSGASYGVAGISYIPHGASRVLEKRKGEYAVSYLPHGAAVVFNRASDLTDSVDSYLSTEKIEQICTK